ncbi:hypothetical protein INT45_014129 [Circinella minor]|uniref:Uncharacterized protein n=1 Tax=Circinella minor TaxID=1195481 RepID=A0A8H7RP89_9FUNG|nr:hypothetical protein INT45_014129 [Circinella minor]
MPQTISNSAIERVQNDTFRPQLPLKYGGRKLGEWNIFVFYASLQTDDAHPEYEVAKMSIGLPEGFKWKGTSDPELKRIFSSRAGTEAGKFISERTELENLRRDLPPTNDHDRKEVEEWMIRQLVEVFGTYEDKLDVDVDVVGRALISLGLGAQFHRSVASQYKAEYVPRKKVRNRNSCVSKAAHKMRMLLENKTDKELKRFPWSEFKLTKSDVYPDKHYYYHSGEKLAIVGFDYGVDHRTGLHYKTAVNPKDLFAEKQQQLEKALDDNTVHLVKEDEILQFLLLW